MLSTISVAVWATGGFAVVVSGSRLSARSPDASAGAAVLTFALWLVAAWRARAVAADLSAVDTWIDRRAGCIAAIVAGVAAAVAVRYGTFSASGADPSGYLSEAAMLASGALSYAEPLTSVAGWSDAARTLAPLGWQASGAQMQVPTYAVGLPLLMAPPHAFGGPVAASLVVALSAGLAAWWTGRIAYALGGGVAAVLATIWLATVPVQLFESMQPMSDVPVTAAWLACWWVIAKSAQKGTVPFSKVAEVSFSRIALGAGGCAAAAAVLIRPNLAPLAAVPALFVWTQSPRREAVIWFAVPVALAGALIAYLQWRWFGSPFRSGYGSASEIYSFSNVAPNVLLYFGWLVETHNAWLLAAPLALLARSRALVGWMLAFAALVCLAYLIYGRFEAWPYLRFLLPALAIACIATAVAVARGVGLLPVTARVPIVIALTLGIGGLHIHTARQLGVFRIAARHSRALLAGQYLDSALPPHAVLITGEQSGAMRYYTGRSIVRWDFIDASQLPQVEQQLAEAGRDVWIVLDDWEAPRYREKFRSAPFGGLDWPPIVDAGTESRTIAWRLRDRTPFLASGRVITDRVR